MSATIGVTLADQFVGRLASPPRTARPSSRRTRGSPGCGCSTSSDRCRRRSSGRDVLAIDFRRASRCSAAAAVVAGAHVDVRRHVDEMAGRRHQRLEPLRALAARAPASATLRWRGCSSGWRRRDRRSRRSTARAPRRSLPCLRPACRRPSRAATGAGPSGFRRRASRRRDRRDTCASSSRIASLYSTAAPSGRLSDPSNSVWRARRRTRARSAGARAASATALLRLVVGRLLALRIDVEVDVRSERQRDAPVRHRRRRVELGGARKRTDRLVVIEAVDEVSP